MSFINGPGGPNVTTQVVLPKQKWSGSESNCNSLLHAYKSLFIAIYGVLTVANVQKSLTICSAINLSLHRKWVLVKPGAGRSRAQYYKQLLFLH